MLPNSDTPDQCLARVGQERGRRTRRPTHGIFLAAFLVLSSPVAFAAEQRCDELGANCLCSEPLNTSTYVLVPGTDWGWNPADSTTKECSFEGAAGAVMSLATPGSLGGKGGSSDPALLSKLPAGHTNTFVLKGEDGHTGQWFLGHKLKSSDPVARVAMRAYHFYSEPYDFMADNFPTCANSGKLLELGVQGAIVTNAGGGWGVYSWNAGGTGLQGPWGPSYIDCCARGPGYDAASVSSLSDANMKGKWWRTEMVVKNRSGSPGIVIQVFMKNVTDDGPEYKIVDTSKECSTADCGAGTGWTSAFASGLQPPAGSPIEDLWWDFFRNGTCVGYQAISHILVAGWNTDADQRIGAAIEIEGPGSNPPSDGGSLAGDAGNPTGGSSKPPSACGCGSAGESVSSGLGLLLAWVFLQARGRRLSKAGTDQG